MLIVTSVNINMNGKNNKIYEYETNINTII